MLLYAKQEQAFIYRLLLLIDDQVTRQLTLNSVHNKLRYLYHSVIPLQGRTVTTHIYCEEASYHCFTLRSSLLS